LNNKILVTGAFGFIGSHLVETLVEQNMDVIAFDRYTSDSNYGWLEDSKYKNEIEFYLGDIRDYESVFKAMNKCKVCLHLAALIGIPYSYMSPLAYVRTNIDGTYNVLESAKNLNLEQIIITSTSEVYGSAKTIPINEEHRFFAQSPYSASKIAADQLAISYYNAFDTPIKIIRPFNTFGPRQSARAIIPTIISQSINSKNVIKLGNTDVFRDFTYVTDLCNAYLYAMNCKKLYGEIFNVGNNKKIEISELIKEITSKLNVHIEILKDQKRIRKDRSEVKRLQADNSKFMNFTEWKPLISLSQGLDLTIDWIKNNKSHFNKDIYYV